MLYHLTDEKETMTPFIQMDRNNGINASLNWGRSGGDVVDNTLDYQPRDRKIDPPLHRSFG